MFDVLTVKDVKINLGSWCKNLRKKERITQQELALELSLSRITISNLEKGENFTIETLLKVLHYFNQMKTFNAFIIGKLESNESLY